MVRGEGPLFHRNVKVGVEGRSDFTDVGLARRGSMEACRDGAAQGQIVKQVVTCRQFAVDGAAEIGKIFIAYRILRQHSVGHLEFQFTVDGVVLAGERARISGDKALETTGAGA